MAAYLKPTAPIAADALLPSDPGHALLLAQELLEAPLMSNHSYGLWGYHGETADGRTLTIQSTGIGGPSAAVVVRELSELGVTRAVRVGPCTPLDGGLADAEVVVVERAHAVAGDLAGDADPELTRRLAEVAGPAARAGPVASLDPPRDGAGIEFPGALATDLESAAVLAAAPLLGVAGGALLVAGAPSDAAVLELGRTAAAALGPPPRG